MEHLLHKVVLEILRLFFEMNKLISIIGLKKS